MTKFLYEPRRIFPFSVLLLLSIGYIDFTHTHTHTRLTAHCPGLPRWSGTRQLKPIWILLKQEIVTTTTTDSEWQWHQLGHMQVCTSLQTDNHASTSLLSFLQAECPSCRQPRVWKHWRNIHWFRWHLIFNNWTPTSIIPTKFEFLSYEL